MWSGGQHLPYNASYDNTDKGIECLQARANFTITTAHTICYRFKADAFAGPGGYPYVDLLQFGVMKADMTDITEGYLWGNYPDGESGTSN